jgi:hypothetical protein
MDIRPVRLILTQPVTDERHPHRPDARAKQAV